MALCCKYAHVLPVALILHLVLQAILTSCLVGRVKPRFFLKQRFQFLHFGFWYFLPVLPIQYCFIMHAKPIGQLLLSYLFYLSITPNMF